MISVKDAAKAAEEYARELFSADDLRHLRLEEVRLSEDEQYWNITLGWVDDAAARPSAVLGNLAFNTQKLPRIYKVFEVDVESGQVRAMKMRDVE